MPDRKPDMLSEILVMRQPALAGKVHYVDGRPHCDGVNHTTRCDPDRDHDPATCRNGDHYGQCSGTTYG